MLPAGTLSEKVAQSSSIEDGHEPCVKNMSLAFQLIVFEMFCFFSKILPSLTKAVLSWSGLVLTAHKAYFSF